MVNKYLIALSLSFISGELMSHTSLEQLVAQRKNGQQLVEIGAIYCHYRDPKLTYKVIDIAIQEATEKVCVIYKALYMGDEMTWVRDLDSWLATVDHEGKKVSRFYKVK